MLSGISSLLFFARRLTPALLDTLHESGAEAIEIFAARHHFDYTDRGAVRELANWFAANPVQPSMHMPLFTAGDEVQWSRHTQPTLNLIDTAKTARIDAMDEVKRALEAAEQINFRSCVLHLGLKDDRWDTRALDDSLTSIEHLKAFAGPLGVRLLLENLTNDVATPQHLVDIVHAGHFDSVGFCLDVGHAHLAEGIPETAHSPAKSAIEIAFEAFGSRLSQLHVHDNHGTRDDHLWPEDGKIPWADLLPRWPDLPADVVSILEPNHELGVDERKAKEKAQEAFALLRNVHQELA